MALDGITNLADDAAVGQQIVSLAGTDRIFIVRPDPLGGWWCTPLDLANYVAATVGDSLCGCDSLGDSLGDDPDAIHVNETDEIHGIPEKLSLAGNELLVGEDPDGGEYDKISLEIDTLVDYVVTAVGDSLCGCDSLAGTDDDAIHVNVAGEIVAIAEKTTPTYVDEVVIEDANDLNKKKSLKIGNLARGTRRSRSEVFATTYTLSHTDCGKVIDCTHASGCTITIPTLLDDLFIVGGFYCWIRRSGGAVVTIDENGNTLEIEGGQTTIDEDFGEIKLVKSSESVDANHYVWFGTHTKNSDTELLAILAMGI